MPRACRCAQKRTPFCTPYPTPLVAEFTGTAISCGFTRVRGFATIKGRAPPAQKRGKFHLCNTPFPPLAPCGRTACLPYPLRADRYLKLASAYQLQALLLLLRHGAVSAPGSWPARWVSRSETQTVLWILGGRGSAAKRQQPGSPCACRAQHSTDPGYDKVPSTMGARPA